VKNRKDAVSKESPINNSLFYGDVCSSPIEHIAAYVDEV